MNYNEEYNIMRMTDLSLLQTNVLMIYYKDLSVKEKIEINKDKQSIFQEKIKEYKNMNKAELDYISLLIALKNSYTGKVSDIYSKENNIKIKRKKRSKKIEALLFHARWILAIRKSYSLRELSTIIRKKKNIEVSHTHIASFIKQYERGEI